MAVRVAPPPPRAAPPIDPAARQQAVAELEHLDGELAKFRRLAATVSTNPTYRTQIQAKIVEKSRQRDAAQARVQALTPSG